MGKYKDVLDYLTQTLNYLTEQHTTVLGQLRECKTEMESLQIDLPNITTKRLQEAGMKTHNHFSMEAGRLAGLIKDIREEQQLVKICIKNIMNYRKIKEDLETKKNMLKRSIK